MSEFFTEEIRSEIREHLIKMEKPVRLVYFTQKHACGACREQENLLKQLVDLSDKLTLQILQLVKDSAEAKNYGIDKVPATVVATEKDPGIRFYGLTGGYEFESLLESILMLSTEVSGLDPAIETLATQIDSPVHLEVMVTLTCPYCPNMVRLAHQLAFVNENIRADMIESSEFPTLVQRYEVNGVPRTIINEGSSFEGALPANSVIMEILKSVNPDKYERIETALRDASGERLAKQAESDLEYDVLVVGVGPAALSAALYAVRKNRSVALVGDKFGGQINDTAIVENYLGMPQVSGQELSALFRQHVEAYPVSERLRVRVKKIIKKGNTFELTTEDDLTYLGRSVIYAAGKEYRRLGVLGEDRFIGKGIAFCATCDAPLYRGKRVAVIGGGNSALTAVRDLIGYAKDIQLIHILGKLQADAVLIEAARKAPNVTFHLNTEVREFLGKNHLEGIRVASTDRKERYDLQVNGIFLEIGLIPNTDPVKELLTLNQTNEITVERDQSTSLPGFFAAGDVTDVQDKQIIVAAGDGARAALAVDRYLSEIELSKANK